MQCRQIEFGSAEYELSLALRHEVLRRPLGLSLSNEDTKNDAGQWHFALFAEDQYQGQGQGQLLACLVVNPLSPLKVKLRQMAVAPDCQRQGLGQLLVKATENFLRNRNVQTVELHARSSATGFYQRLGYEPSGPVFSEVGIDHQKMWKQLL
jgi:predicted GNAT family N-acyltransferase